MLSKLILTAFLVLLGLAQANATVLSVIPLAKSICFPGFSPGSTVHSVTFTPTPRTFENVTASDMVETHVRHQGYAVAQMESPMSQTAEIHYHWEDGKLYVLCFSHNLDDWVDVNLAVSYH